MLRVLTMVAAGVLVAGFGAVAAGAVGDGVVSFLAALSSSSARLCVSRSLSFMLFRGA
jgi:hypothetical protein